MRIWPLLLITLIFLSGCINYRSAGTYVPNSADCEKEIAKIPQIIKDNTGEALRLFEVSKTVDGDTIELGGGQKVRFLEINTPEKGMKWAAEATQLTDSLTKNGVYLQKDAENEDKYGRWLRYVFTNDGFVNAELIRQGLATVFIVGNDTKYAVLMKCLEQEAKQNKRGIWSATSKYDVSLFVNYDAPGSDSENVNGEYVVITNTGTETIDMQNWSIKDEATHIYTFGNVELNSRDNLTLYTGKGQDTETELYWNSKEPIWNNDGDTAFLFDENGDLVTLASFP
jgi:micrococcal nuclease